MPELTRIHVDCYLTVDSLIDAVCRGVEVMRPFEVGEWYAERLEAAAKEIRIKNEWTFTEQLR